MKVGEPLSPWGGARRRADRAVPPLIGGSRRRASAAFGVAHASAQESARQHFRLRAKFVLKSQLRASDASLCGQLSLICCIASPCPRSLSVWNLSSAPARFHSFLATFGRLASTSKRISTASPSTGPRSSLSTLWGAQSTPRSPTPTPSSRHWTVSLLSTFLFSSFPFHCHASPLRQLCHLRYLVPAIRPRSRPLSAELEFAAREGLTLPFHYPSSPATFSCDIWFRSSVPTPVLSRRSSQPKGASMLDCARHPRSAR